MRNVMRDSINVFAALMALGALAPRSSAQIGQIAQMTVHNSCIDMDAVGPVGPTSVPAINAAGTNGGANIAGITLEAVPNAPPAVYDTGTGEGRALALVGGGLALIDPGATFTPFRASIQLGMPSTQIGFSLGDWAGLTTVGLRFKGKPVGFQVFSLSGGPFYFELQGGGAFDTLEVAIPAPVPIGLRNFVFPALYVQTPAPPVSAELESPPDGSIYCAPCVCELCSDDDDLGVGVADPVYFFSGELHEEAVDLRIPGRGLDFVWARKYRSKIGPDTAMGHGWDFSYNVFLETNGNDVVLHDGNSRADLYRSQPNNTWALEEYFRELTRNPDESFTLTFSDTGMWHFHPLNHPNAPGKLSRIEDRNANTLDLWYDTQGRLERITDTLSRDILIAYNNDDLIESVTDFSGRQVTYVYYTGEPGGSPGDLKSATSPVVVGTSTGNDFPNGKTTVYTYTSGFTDDRLNHNLLSITDPKGQTYVQNVYAHTIDAGDPRFTLDPNNLYYDRLVRQYWGDQPQPGFPNTGDIIDIVYVPVTPSSQNNFATIKVIANDRNGDVKEFLYDANNRGVIKREYTGRWPANQPTFQASNPPTPKSRAGDPDFFETRYEYNVDALRTRIIHPNGNITENVYELDLDPNAARRSRGNLREVHRTPGTHTPPGDQTEIVELYEYDTGFGGCCGTNFVTRAVDGRGHVTIHEYDQWGNRFRTTHRIPTIIEGREYDERHPSGRPTGQVTAHILPDNGSGHRRRDEYTYYDSGHQRGYLRDEIIDAPGFALTATYEYDLVGNVIRHIDPRGHDTLYEVNALNQIVRETSREVINGSGVRYERDMYYDANDNAVRNDIQNIDDQGALQPNTHFTTIFEYEILNYLVRKCEEAGTFTGAIPGPPELPACAGLPDSEFITTEFAYDANRNRTLVVYGEAAEGRQPDNVVRTRYDERDLVFKEIRAPRHANQSTTQHDYDRNTNRVRKTQGLEGTSPRVTESTYDGYDRLVGTLDAMGNEAEYHYDPNHNRVSSLLLGELIDAPGSGGNVRLWEAVYVFDEMDRRRREEVEFFQTEPPQPPILDGQSITQTEWSDNSQVTRTVNDNHHQSLTTYDTANRVLTVTDAKNNRITYAYDANSNVIRTTELEKSDLGTQDEAYRTTSAYDNLDRLISRTDNVSNRNRYAYDSRNNLAEMIDALDRETRHANLLEDAIRRA